MGCLSKRKAQNPTHVAALLLTEYLRQPRLCFVLPTVAVIDGRDNHTLPGGAIHQTSSKRFETSEAALLRETREETGSPKENFKRYACLGPPILHYTNIGKQKHIQPFAAVLHQPYDQPQRRDEIAAVRWCRIDDWEAMLATMNEGKRLLALGMMREAALLRDLFPCMRRALRGFLQETNPQLLAG
jgi:8-oxo-dGTP pyrophosphatase MutT (NUDIX family)